MASKNFIKREHSNAPLRGYSWNRVGGTVYPSFSFDAVLNLLDNDPVARGAVAHYVDKCMEGDYSIITRDTRKYDPDTELRLEEKYMFRTKILRKIFLQGIMFRNVFIEIVRDMDNHTKALNVLDSTMVDVVTEPNGDLVKVFSKIPNPVTGEIPEWDKKDIVWIKFGDRTAGWAPVEIRALWENLLLKSYITRYVGWLWKTGQYRLIYNFNKASNQDIEDFLAYARKNDEHYDVPFVAKGELKTSLLRDMKETSSLVELLKYLDSQTLILLRIPPIDAGIPDASGRSNADAQANNIESTVASNKKIVQDYVNFELFPKISKSNFLLEFAPMNRFAEHQLYKVVETMNNLGMKQEVMQEFLRDHGIHFQSTKFFNEIKETPLDSAFKQAKGQYQEKAFGDGNKPQEEVTTREDQLHTNR
jgi:hypothetical protein